MKNKSQRGVALVITLIMLSVITFLTIAFLAVSRRDRASVTTSLNQTDARFMADSALQRFQSDLVTRMVVNGSLLNYDLMQTRNFVNPNGFNEAVTGLDTNNVNYDETSTGGALSTDDRIRNIGNLFFDPRPPVFVKNNDGTTDFRFYLDYNRNGRFETNGIQPIVIDEAGNTNGVANFNGEPEWIGVLRNPLAPHSATNPFVGRYLYLAVPVGKALDLNHGHNYAKANVSGRLRIPGNDDGFIRNQGVGSWEMNFGAFLVDLNTNIYVKNAGVPYTYFANASARNRGDAFQDALQFLNYRYDGNFDNVASAGFLYGATGRTAFRTDLIDEYTTQPITNAPFSNLNDPDGPPMDLTGQPWSGADNLKNYFDLQDIFNPAKTSPAFVNKLQAISTNNNSYDRYTFSRLLEQMATGSEPEVVGKINLNYTNDPTSNVVPTNFVSWTPIQFFTNTVDRLIQDNLVALPISPTQTNYFLFNTNGENLVSTNTVTINSHNIELYPKNQYTAQLHRLLQLAANIYDATTTNKYPSIFRPVVQGTPAVSRIVDYLYETNSQFVADYFNNPIQDRTNIVNPTNLVWGVPVVMGAKKGFPSFSKFVARNFIQISRNLQVIKTSTNADPTVINQMLTFGVSNIFAMETWNSYIAPYTNSVRLISTNFTTLVMTNSAGVVVWPSNGQATNYGFTNKFDVAFWPSVRAGSNAFIVSLFTNATFLTNSQYYAGQTPAFKTNISNFQRNAGFPFPDWGITMTNRLVFALIDTSQPMGRVIDFVNLDNLICTVNVGQELIGSESVYPLANVNELRNIWKTNPVNNALTPILGIQNQIYLSMGYPYLTDENWKAFGNKDPGGKKDAIANFARFMLMTPPPETGYQNIPVPNYTNTMAPFSPTREMVQTVYWQINDPMVHYTVEDLQDERSPTNFVEFPIPASTPPQPLKLRTISERYRPWGRKFGGGDEIGPLNIGRSDESDFAYDARLKDPRVRWSDDWDFPTNKYPNIGWLGKVHRGTPWQTIYLKADMIPTNDWKSWAGNVESHPTNDWKLMDLFYTSPNDNAARGLLSVNQTNLAAWSAALSGMVLVTNAYNDATAQIFDASPAALPFQSTIMQPNTPELVNILNDINGTRLTNYGGTFPSLGSILSVPRLSVGRTNALTSPALNAGSAKQRMYGLNDDAYERIPRQLMSLLKLGKPQYVIYCYGQSLKPANNSLALDAPDDRLFNICTNYQITGEVVTRTVLRVDGPIEHPKTVIQNYNILPGD